MEKLSFSDEVFEKGAGKIYQTLIYATLPALFVGVILISVINSGLLTNFAGTADWIKMLLMILIVIYVVPGLFILPTVWMLRSWKTRDMRNSYVLVGKKSIEYHKVTSRSSLDMKENVYFATQIKKVEEAPRKYTVIGNIVEKGTGIISSELVIPKAYENMDRIKRAARYR